MRKLILIFALFVGLFSFAQGELDVRTTLEVTHLSDDDGNRYEYVKGAEYPATECFENLNIEGMTIMSLILTGNYGSEGYAQDISIFGTGVETTYRVDPNHHDRNALTFQTYRNSDNFYRVEESGSHSVADRALIACVADAWAPAQGSPGGRGIWYTNPARPGWAYNDFSSGSGVSAVLTNQWTGWSASLNQQYLTSKRVAFSGIASTRQALEPSINTFIDRYEATDSSVSISSGSYRILEVGPWFYAQVMNAAGEVTHFEAFPTRAEAVAFGNRGGSSTTTTASTQLTLDGEYGCNDVSYGPNQIRIGSESPHWFTSTGSTQGGVKNYRLSLLNDRLVTIPVTQRPYIQVIHINGTIISFAVYNGITHIGNVDVDGALTAADVFCGAQFRNLINQALAPHLGTTVDPIVETPVGIWYESNGEWRHSDFPGFYYRFSITSLSRFWVIYNPNGTSFSSPFDTGVSDPEGAAHWSARARIAFEHALANGNVGSSSTTYSGRSDVDNAGSYTIPTHNILQGTFQYNVIRSGRRNSNVNANFIFTGNSTEMARIAGFFGASIDRNGTGQFAEDTYINFIETAGPFFYSDNDPNPDYPRNILIPAGTYWSYTVGVGITISGLNASNRQFYGQTRQFSATAPGQNSFTTFPAGTVLIVSDSESL